MTKLTWLFSEEHQASNCSLKKSHASFVKEDNKVIISPEKDFSDVVAQSQTLFPLEAKSQVPNGRNEIPFHSKNIHQSPSVC